MRSPDYKDKLEDYSGADRAIIQASLNQSRYDSKKGSAKKTVKPVAKKTSPKMPGKGPAVKVTDSRFKGMGAEKPKSSGSMSYTAGSAKNNKATYTTGSGVSKPAAKPAAKGMSNSTKAKVIGGAVLAGGLIAARATGPGRAIGAAVGLGKAVAGAVGRGTATKALSTSGRLAAKTKGEVSTAQYNAMLKVASKAPKKLVKTKAAAMGAGTVLLVPKPKKK